jgi:hypothetical protein
MPKTKKNIKVRDLKPNKDAKGGGGFKPQGGTAESGTGVAGGGTSVSGGGTSVAGGGYSSN